MKTMETQKLSVWLSGKLNELGWSQRELARRSGLSQTVISGVISEDKKAGKNFCEKVAAALGEPPENILRMAGFLPKNYGKTTDLTKDEAKLLEIYRGASTVARRYIMVTVEAMSDSGKAAPTDL
jgi:transcriptional regulator with XRE-family HTH domain